MEVSSTLCFLTTAFTGNAGDSQFAQRIVENCFYGHGNIDAKFNRHLLK